MKTNIHPADRILRIIVGLFLMSLAFWGPASLWFLLGIVPFTTGLMGWCPLYSIFGISTCKRVTP
jgi:hypothetical protein